jgi:peptidoglycan/xylan/chitin deacetylase (PgdA/CDA1 family)
LKITVWQRFVNQYEYRAPRPRRRLTLPRGALSVTFDDFPRSAWTVAGPILADHGARGTYFVSGGFCGADYRGLPHFIERDLGAVAEAGHEIGCHTFHHLSAFETDVGRWVASVEENARFVGRVVPGIRMSSFAFPYGHVRGSHRRALAGRFDTLRGIRLLGSRTDVDPTLLPAGGLEVAQPGVDWEALVAAAAAERSWLILYTHDVAENPSPYGTTPRALERVLRLAATAGLDLLPVSEAWARAAAPGGADPGRSAKG